MSVAATGNHPGIHPRLIAPAVSASAQLTYDASRTSLVQAVTRTTTTIVAIRRDLFLMEKLKSCQELSAEGAEA
jgi:hypothetical protein